GLISEPGKQDLGSRLIRADTVPDEPMNQPRSLREANDFKGTTHGFAQVAQCGVQGGGKHLG
ncbi:hypothetical protein, partial [Limnohabitans sp.]|uniref:hypothetical protein n=1 Tax=Limnohabitans sp. TaxID=1907725 RepID=UPI00333F5A54